MFWTSSGEKGPCGENEEQGMMRFGVPQRFGVAGKKTTLNGIERAAVRTTREDLAFDF